MRRANDLAASPIGKKINAAKRHPLPLTPTTYNLFPTYPYSLSPTKEKP